jgi:hypothetical protein
MKRSPGSDLETRGPEPAANPFCYFVAAGRLALVLISIVAALSVPHSVCAQTSPPSPEVPMTGMKPDRTVADQASRQMMREKEAALKKKRAGCRYHAKIQNLSLLERRRFIRDCMSF